MALFTLSPLTTSLDFSPLLLPTVGTKSHCSLGLLYWMCQSTKIGTWHVVYRLQRAEAVVIEDAGKKDAFSMHLLLMWEGRVAEILIESQVPTTPLEHQHRVQEAGACVASGRQGMEGGSGSSCPRLLSPAACSPAAGPPGPLGSSVSAEVTELEIRKCNFKLCP